MIDILSFLEHTVDRYIVGDLRKMQTSGPDVEGVGFPVLLTTFAAIELLGGLLSEKEFDSFSGRRYFRAYWEQQLYPSPSANAVYGAPLYQLVRHGVAHAYVMKGRIGVLQRRPELHLTRRLDGLFIIDAAKLADDFITSYETCVKPIVAVTTGRVNRDTMQLRLNKMEELDKDVAADWQYLLDGAPPSPVVTTDTTRGPT